MSALPIDVRAILPSQEELLDMGRRRYQCPNVLKTAGKRQQWYIRYVVDVITGPGTLGRKEVTKYLGECKAMGKREAEKLRDDFIRTVNRPDIVIPSQVAFSHVVRAYRDAFLPGCKPNTQATYESVLTAHIEPFFGGLRMCDIRKETVQAWIHTKATASPAQRRKLLRVMSSVWEQATQWEYAQGRNPAQNIKIADDGAGRRREIRALTPDEIRRLLAAADMKRADLPLTIRLALYCGLRIGEILGLRWCDIQPGCLRVDRSMSQANRQIVDPKSRSGKRLVPLPTFIQFERNAAAKTDDLIFQFSHNSLKQRMSDLGRSIGFTWFGFGFHQLRRTYATMMDGLGADNLRDTMGHSTEAMSQKYVSRSFVETAERQVRMAEIVIGSEKVGRA